MPTTTERTGIFPELTASIEDALDRVVPDADTSPTTLHQAMRHAVFAGGKRLRPLLVHATGKAITHEIKNFDAPACAVELIHTYSLIHDDLPSMDNDSMRRGKPTCHVVYGPAMAILAGDALQALAFEVLARDDSATTDPAAHARMLQCLGTACGSSGMAGGQALDLEATATTLTLDELVHMHQCKTGALIRASVQLGALAGGCGDEQTLAGLDAFAWRLGLAFQIRDDILDIEGDSATLGKTAGKDTRQAKSTFPSLMGLDGSREYCRRLMAEAHAQLAELDADTSMLEALADFTVQRNA